MTSRSSTPRSDVPASQRPFHHERVRDRRAPSRGRTNAPLFGTRGSKAGGKSRSKKGSRFEDRPVSASLLDFPTFGSSIEQATEARVARLHELCLERCCSDERTQSLATELTLNFQSILQPPQPCCDSDEQQDIAAHINTTNATVEVSMELQQYPFGCSKRKMNERPIVVSAPYPFAVVRPGLKPPLDIVEGKQCGHMFVIKCDVEEQKHFAVKLRSEDINPTQKSNTHVRAGGRKAEDAEMPLVAVWSAVEDRLWRQVYYKGRGTLGGGTIDEIDHDDTSGNLQDDTTEEYARLHIQDIRQVLRHLKKKGLHTCASALEGATKGLVMAFRELISQAEDKHDSLAAQLQNHDDESLNADTLQQCLQKMRTQRDALSDTLKDNAARQVAEKQLLNDRIESLREEVERLSPNVADLDHMTTMITDFAAMVSEMEAESSKQGKILEDVGTITRSMVQEVNADPQELHHPARIVQMTDGQILLRHFDVTDADVQVYPYELMNMDGPLILRMPLMRQVLSVAKECSRAGFKVEPPKTLADLEKKVEKIFEYATSSAPQAPKDFAKLCVAYYCSQATTMSEAHCHVAALYTGLFWFLYSRQSAASDRTSQKCSLMARFLEFCPLKDALPPSIVHAVFKAKLLMDKAKVVGRGTTLGNLFNVASKEVITTEAAFKVFYGGIEKALALASNTGRHSGDVLITCLQEVLLRDQAPKLKELIHRAEDRQELGMVEMGIAIKEALGYLVDWKPVFVQANKISSHIVLDKLGIGDSAPKPQLIVDECASLELLANTIMASVNIDAKPFTKMWITAEQTNIPQMRDILQRYDASVSLDMENAFLSHITTYSHSLSSLSDLYGNVEGSLRPDVSGKFGGDVVTLEMAHLALLRSGIITPGIPEKEELPTSANVPGRTSVRNSRTTRISPPSPKSKRGGATLKT